MEDICVGRECCSKISEIQKEIDSYQQCVERSLQEISSLNVKYEKTVNELSSIINIFEYINLVTDYKNLFSVINDMLIGVLGVTCSTIYSFDGDSFSIETSSISRQQVKKMNGITTMLLNRLKDFSETIILNEAELSDEFSKERKIKAAVVVPLNSKNRLIGIIYLEHTIENYFAVEDIKYLNTLAVAIRLSLENAQLYSKLEEMALRDGLTGIYNRMFFNKEIQNCMENYKKFSLPFVLAILDIDHFKKVNDTYGHICGDLVLKEISDIIKQQVRKDDIVCRYGGEEFAVIFKNTSDMKSVIQRVEDLRAAIKEKVVNYNEHEISVTCSFGLASSVLCTKATTTEELTQYADEALYNAKHTGRDRVCVYNNGV